MPEQEQAERWQYQMITHEREALKAALTQAHAAVRTAQLSVKRLSGADIFDVEYAEGDAGRDITALLAQAATFLRAAEAITGSVPE